MIHNENAEGSSNSYLISKIEPGEIRIFVQSFKRNANAPEIKLSEVKMTSVKTKRLLRHCNAHNTILYIVFFKLYGHPYN